MSRSFNVSFQQNFKVVVADQFLSEFRKHLVEALETGEVNQWGGHVMVFPVANAKFTGEVTCG